MSASLPGAFLGPPIAHRGLHGPECPENSLEAFEAAAAAGYGIELDVQLTADGEAAVFHDATLDRMTATAGPVRARSLDDLRALPLRGGGRLAGLEEVVRRVGGRVPVLVEIKDQSGALGATDGRLEAAVARALAAATGPIAVMSFNPESVVRMRDLAPDIPRGLTTEAFPASGWPSIPEATLERLRGIPDRDRAGASFISHDWHDLDRPRVAELKSGGTAILCWTIHSAEAEAKARGVADNVCFEGYRASIPPA